MSDDTDGEIQYSQVENFIFFAQFFRYADRMHDAVVTLHRQSENDVRSPLRLTKMEAWVSGRNQPSAKGPNSTRVPKVRILLLPHIGILADLVYAQD